MSLSDAFIAEPPPLHVDQDGVVRVAKTRVTLDTVIHAYQRGEAAEEIANAYETLELTDIYGALFFYLRHKKEVEAYLEARRLQAEEVRRQNEALWPSYGIRERLLARRKETVVR